MASGSTRVLLLSSDDQPDDKVERELVDAGFDVHRCHEPGAPPFPCVGLAGGRCPLDAEGGIDVAVDVRSLPWRLPTRNEMGVTCALRAHVPVVVVTRGSHPFEALGALTAAPDAPIVEVIGDAVSAGLAEARQAAEEAVAAVLATHGLAGAPFTVQLDRRQGHLHAVIAADVPHAVAAMAATRVAVAIRRFDAASTSLDIDVAGLTAP
jgi:hypothetical protein